MIVISESGPRLTLQVIGSFQMAEPLYPPSAPRRSETIDNAGDRTRIAVPSRIRRTIGFGERAFKAPILEAEAVSSRIAGAPAQEEIDEPTGKFLRPRSDIAHLELLA